MAVKNSYGEVVSSISIVMLKWYSKADRGVYYKTTLKFNDGNLPDLQDTGFTFMSPSALDIIERAIVVGKLPKPNRTVSNVSYLMSLGVSHEIEVIDVKRKKDLNK